MTWHKLGDICEFKYGSSLPAAARSGDAFPVYGSNGVVGAHLQSLTDGPTIVVGRKGSIGEVNFSSGPCWPIDTTYFIDRTATKADLRWLSYALSGLRLGELNKATGVPGLNRNDAYEKLIYVPPLKEQKRIAAILDQADELRRKRQRALDRLNRLGQAIFIELFGDQFDRSEMVRLENVASQIDYGLTASAEISGDGPKFLRITDIQNGRVNWESVPVCTASPKQVIDKKLEVGDIVFARTGATTGKSFLIEDCPEDAVFASYLIRVRPAMTIEPEFLFGFFQSRSYWTQISGMAQGAAQPGVNSSKLKELRLPLPSIEAQGQFKVARQRIAQQEGSLSSSLTVFDRLFTSLQHRAFRGEL